MWGPRVRGPAKQPITTLAVVTVSGSPENQEAGWWAGVGSPLLRVGLAEWDDGAPTAAEDTVSTGRLLPAPAAGSCRAMNWACAQHIDTPDRTVTACRVWCRDPCWERRVVPWTVARRGPS